MLPAQNLWPAPVRGILYTVAILYIFLGIAIAADVFMLSIEMITSKKRLVVTYDYEQGKSVQKEVYVWNETVANLTLMALGSSAPEILIAVIETISNLDTEYNVASKPRDLGTFTIIGSASYNMLVISAVCIMSVSSKTVKRIGEFGVFIITSIWSLFAYFWLLIVLKWSSPNIVEVWEAVLTLIFFPLLVISAWCQDRSWWKHKFLKRRRSAVAVRVPQPKESHPYSGVSPMLLACLIACLRRCLFRACLFDSMLAYACLFMLACLPVCFPYLQLMFPANASQVQETRDCLFQFLLKQQIT